MLFIEPCKIALKCIAGFLFCRPISVSLNPYNNYGIKMFEDALPHYQNISPSCKYLINLKEISCNKKNLKDVNMNVHLFLPA